MDANKYHVNRSIDMDGEFWNFQVPIQIPYFFEQVPTPSWGALLFISAHPLGHDIKQASLSNKRPPPMPNSSFFKCRKSPNIGAT